MPSTAERLAAIETEVRMHTDALGRIEEFISKDRIAIEGRLARVEHQITVRSWLGGALIAAAQFAQAFHLPIPGVHQS